MEFNDTDHLLYDTTQSNATDAEEYLKFYETTQFVIGLICLPIFGFFGVVGNALSFYIFKKHKPKSSTDVFFMALCISDSFKIVYDFLYFTLILCHRFYPEIGHYVLHSLYSFGLYSFHASISTSAWLVVALTGNNYVAVYKYSSTKELCTASRATRFCIMISISMLLVTIPYALQYKSEPYYDNTTDSIYYELEVTEIWSDVSFSRTYTGFMFAIYPVLPLILTIALSICIIHGLTKDRITPRRNIIIMAVVVTVVFVFCTFPHAVFSMITEFSHHETTLFQHGIHLVLDFLLLLNASVNIVIFAAFRGHFRNGLVALLTRRQAEQVDTRRLSQIALLPRRFDEFQFEQAQLCH